MPAPLVVAVAWLAAGIAIGLFRPLPAGMGPVFILALAGAAWSALQARHGPRAAHGRARGRHGAARTTVLFLLAGMALGVGARAGRDRACRARLPADVPLLVVGRVEPAPGPESGRVRLAVDRVRIGGWWLECGEELPGRVDGPTPRAGPVVARARWWTPPGAEGTLGRPGLLLLDRVRAVASESGAGRPWGAFALHRALRERIDRLFPDHGPLVASLLLAQRDGLDRAVRERYARAGLSHLLAISGLHVGLVAGILLLLAGALRLEPRVAAALAGAGTVAYVLFLGAPDSAARAALQIVLVLAARVLQRPARPEALMAAAALALLARDPTALVAPGFQLSFAGVAGLLVLRGPLKRSLDRLVGRRGGKAGRWLADAVATSAAASLATAPVVAWHFGRVAPVGIGANLLAIPLLGAAVPAMALALLLDLAWPGAGRFLAGGAGLLLGALDRTAAIAAAVPGGTAAVLPATGVLLAAAAGAGYLLSRRLGRVGGPVRAAVWAATAGAVLAAAPLRPGGDRVELHVVDVGQGDAIAIRSPAGRWLLVDAGIARDGWDAGSRRVVPYLGRRGARRLEAVIITHPDADHMGGAAAVIRAFRPRWVGDPGLPAGKAGYLRVLESAAGARTRWVALRRGLSFHLDGMDVTFLYPGPLPPDGEANASSVVLRVEYGEFSALLTGDAPASVERALVERYGPALEADVLKVGHHGSATSTSRELLAAVAPTHALISAGRGNRYGHPHPVVLARLARHGARVYRTDRQGSVVVRGDAAGHIEVRTDRGGRTP